MVLLVAYDIYDPNRDLTLLHNAIKSTGNWWHHLGNVWIVDTVHSPQTMHTWIAPYLMKEDNCLVVRLQKQYYGWLPKEAWEWLNQRGVF